MVLRLGGHLVAAGNFADGDAVPGLVEFRDQLLEQVFDALRGLLQGGGDLRQRQRLLGDIDDGFEDRLELRIFLGDGLGPCRRRGHRRGGHQLVHREARGSAEHWLRRGIFGCGAASSGARRLRVPATGGAGSGSGLSPCGFGFQFFHA